MSESKYGRLFTEGDVKRLMSYAVYVDRQNGPTRRLNPGPAVEGIIAAYEADPDGIGGKLDPPLTFPADEPLFLLRGQDRYAPWGVQFYVDGLASHLADVGRGEANVSREHYDAAHEAWQAMLLWQCAHRDRVKVPD